MDILLMEAIIAAITFASVFSTKRGWEYIVALPAILLFCFMAGLASWVIACGGTGESMRYSDGKLVGAIVFFIGHIYFYGKLAGIALNGK